MKNKTVLFTRKEHFKCEKLQRFNGISYQTKKMKTLCVRISGSSASTWHEVNRPWHNDRVLRSLDWSWDEALSPLKQKSESCRKVLRNFPSLFYLLEAVAPWDHYLSVRFKYEYCRENKVKRFFPKKKAKQMVLHVESWYFLIRISSLRWNFAKT